MTTVQKWSGHEARFLREALRMGTREFAKKLGLNERTITSWEAGASPRPQNQAVLDTTLGMASAEVKERFEVALRVAAASPNARRINVTASSEMWVQTTMPEPLRTEMPHRHGVIAP